MQPDPTTVAIRFAKKWKKLPPGWTDESVEKFWKTLGKGTPKHKVWNCIEKMTDNIPNPGAFCGGLADWQDPGWRSKAKGESSEARSDAKSYWKGKIKKKKDKKAMDDRTAKEHASEEARKKYLAEHREADPKDHTVAGGKGEFPKSLSFPRRQRKTPVRDRKKQRRDRQKQRRDRHYRSLEKRASAARVALRYAARNSPPSMMGSAAMLKRQGLTPVDVWFGEAKPHRRPMLELGDMVQNRRGDLLYFAGVAPDGSAILGKDEREAERLHKQVIEDRKHHSSRAASTNTERYYYKATDGKWYVENEEYEEDWDTGEQIEGEMTHYGPFPSFDAAEKYMRRNFANSGSYSEDDSGRMKPPRNPVRPRRRRWAFNSGPLMLQPDYGHGDAAVPGDQEYHPCQHGKPCQCGGQCGCGG